MSFVNEVEKHVPYEAPILPQEAQFAQNMFQGLSGFMLQMGKKVIEWDRQDKLIADHRKWQKEMFNLENAYNSPVAMAQRMRHAGLNPYAMTGQQVAGSFNSGSYPSSSLMEDPFDNLVKAAQISNINADTTKKEYDAEIAYQEARKKAVEANNFEEYWEVTLANLKKEGDLTDAEIETEKAKALKEFELARKAKEDADQFEEFGEDGGNVYGDASNLSASQTALNNSIVSLNTAKTEYQNILNSNSDAQQKADIQQKLAAAQKSLADALAAQMQAKYTETLDNNATAQEARNAALHVFETAIKENQVSLSLSDAEVAKLNQKVKEISINGPKDFSELDDFIWHNLFGEGGALGKIL